MSSSGKRAHVHALLNVFEHVARLGRESLAHITPHVILQLSERLLVAVAQPDQLHQVHDLARLQVVR